MATTISNHVATVAAGLTLNALFGAVPWAALGHSGPCYRHGETEHKPRKSLRP